MNAYRAGSKFHWIKELSGLWAGHTRLGHVLLSKWLPRVGAAVVAVVLLGSTAVWAAGDGRAPDQLALDSPLPTPIPSTGFYYTVQRGDTLSRIAWRYGTTVYAIVRANGIVNPNLIFYGQRLWIPSSGGGWSGGSTVYIVQRGDTLYSIARRYGTTYRAIAATNGLYYPYTIYVGQRLVIPGWGTPHPPPPSHRVYIVQRGDTLTRIAWRYGTTPWAIAAANGLTNLNYIYVGQRLIIP